MITITPNSEEIKVIRTRKKSGMFIRIGSKGERNHAIHFSRSVADQFAILQFDKLAVVTNEKECWFIKSKDGFIVSVDKNKNTRICDSALVEWFCKQYGTLCPFRLNVKVVNECLYVLDKMKSKIRRF